MLEPAASSIEDRTTPAPFLRWWAGARTSFFWMIAIAFALRFGYILIAHTYKFKTLDNNFSFGFEMGRIGRAIATGRGFADPFAGKPAPPRGSRPLSISDCGRLQADGDLQPCFGADSAQSSTASFLH